MARETATGLIFTRAGCSIACREAKSDDQKVVSCSRSRCGANLHSQTSNSRNFSKKLSNGSSQTRTTSHQATIREGTAPGGAKRLNRNTKISGDNLDCSSRRNEHKQPEIMAKCPSILPKDPPVFAGRTSERLQNCGSSFSSRASKQVMRQSSTKISSVSKFSELAAKRTTQNIGAGVQNNGLKRNIIKSSARSDALPCLLTSVDSGASKRVDLQKRSSNRESSSSRAKNSWVSPTRTLSGLISNFPSNFMPVQASRRPMNLQVDLAMASSRTTQEPKGGKTTEIRQQQQQPADNSISTPALPMIGNDSWNFQSEVPREMDAVIEDDELTNEQYASPGNSFSHHPYDEFRDMRMNIDDMSYEDLLALEERIGNVKTALTEEALSKCVDRTNYTAACLVLQDATCSICQEDYALGEELGKLICSHRYHLACIQDWFQLKNWCPICKSSMSPTD